ncbi:MAG: hypothetical protein ACREBG_23975 [Pyrinomonadaceae bacterium]
MTFVDWPGTPFAPAWIGSAAPTVPSLPGALTVLLDGAADKCGWVVEIPRTGSLQRIAFRISAVANNPDNGLRIAFYTLSAGLPDVETHFRIMPGPFSVGDWVTSNIISSDGSDTGVLKSVTKGDTVVAVVGIESFVAGDSITINTGVQATFNTSPTKGFPYTVRDTGSGLTKGTGLAEAQLEVAFQYNDDVWSPVVGCNPVSSIPTAITLTSSSNPIEAGNQFSVPVPMRLTGFQVLFSLTNATTSTFDAKVYDPNGAVVATKSVGGGGNNLGQETNLGQAGHYLFSNRVELKAFPAVYELAISGTGIGNVVLYPIAFSTIAFKNASPLGSEYSKFTAATVGGARTITSTQQIVLVPTFDGIDPIKGGESVGADSWSPVLFGEEWY